MPRFLTIAVAAAVLLVGVGWQAGAPRRPPKQFLSSLQVGQKVSLKEVGSAYKVSVFGSIGAYTVREIGSDYLQLSGIAGLQEIRIPVYSIQAIETVKTRR